MNDQISKSTAQIFNLEAYHQDTGIVPAWLVPASPYLQLYEAFKITAKQVRETPFFLKLIPEYRMCRTSEQLEDFVGHPFLRKDLKEGTIVLASCMEAVTGEDGMPRLQKVGLSMKATRNGRRISFFHGVFGGDGMRFEALRRDVTYYEFERLYKIEGGKETQLPLKHEALSDMFGGLVPLLNRQRRQSNMRSQYQPLAT